MAASGCERSAVRAVRADAAGVCGKAGRVPTRDHRPEHARHLRAALRERHPEAAPGRGGCALLRTVSQRTERMRPHRTGRAQDSKLRCSTSCVRPSRRPSGAVRRRISCSSNSPIWPNCALRRWQKCLVAAGARSTGRWKSLAGASKGSRSNPSRLATRGWNLQWSDFVELGRTATPACCGMEEVSEQVAQASGLGHFKLASRRLALPYFTLEASTGAGFVSAGCARKPSRIRSEVAMPLTSGRWLRAKAKTYFGFFSKL